MRVVHIVRNYCQNGGMERYVWELTNNLVALGVDVNVICEKCSFNHDPRIRLHKLEIPTHRSRWKAMLAFRSAVHERLKSITHTGPIIIHSHERCLDHHVTTFHGEPVKPRLFPKLEYLISPRLRAWKEMERQELHNPNVQAILPVSKRIQNQLVHTYPKLTEKKMIIAWPGTESCGEPVTKKSLSEGRDLRLVFAGKEWRRKGLSTAVKITESLNRSNTSATLDIFGPSVEELPKIIRQNPFTHCKGWSNDIPWRTYDALLLPAQREPFGMVVTEARAAGVPTLTSTNVGAIDIGISGNYSLRPDAANNEWADALLKLTQNRQNYEPETLWTWDDLARLHLDKIYSQLKI